MKKRIFSILLCVCIIFSIFSVGFTASAAEIKQGIIEIGTVDGITGDTVVVPIKLTENPGIMAVTVSITYDPAVLKYQDFYYGDIFTDYTIAIHPDRKLIRLVICERRNKRNDGNIVSFKFKVLDDAKAELTKIGLEYSKGDFCNWNLDKIMPEVISGGVNVAFNGKNCAHKNYGEWTVISQPVCEKVGISERVCTVCGHKELKEIKEIGHTYSENWTVDKPATAEQEGTMSRYCIRCDDYVDRVTFTLEQSDKENIKNEIWEDIPDKNIGEEIFKEQNPDKELTPNNPVEDDKDDDESDNSIFDADNIINSILPDTDDVDTDSITVLEKIKEAIPEFDNYFEIFKIAIAVLLLLIVI